MKFLILALCVCATSAASFGQYQGLAPSNGLPYGSSSFNPGFGSSSFNPGFGSSGFNPGFGSSGFKPGFGSSGFNPGFGSSGFNPGLGSSGYKPGFGSSGFNPGFGSSGLNPGFGSSGFNPGYGSRAVATASPGAPALYATKTVAPVAYTANGVAQTAAVPVDVAVKTVTPVVAPAEYTTNTDAQVVATPVEYNTNAVVRNVAAPFVTAAKVVATPAVAAVNLAKNLYRDNEATIVRSESNIQPTGYNYVYETNNGISANSVGELKKVGDADVLAVRGSYSYTANDGTPVVITYIADENGYQPQGDVIPVGPAIPEAIARSLAYIAAHPSYEQVQKY